MAENMNEVIICKVCKDEGWVCENHPSEAWNGGDSKCCGGAGMPCKCNTCIPPWHYGMTSETN